MIQHHLRVPPGPVDLGEWATDATPGFDGDKEEGKAALEEVGAELVAAHLTDPAALRCSIDVLSAHFAGHTADPERFRRFNAAVGALSTGYARVLRDRIRALTQIQAHQGINVRSVDDADVIALPGDGDPVRQWVIRARRAGVWTWETVPVGVGTYVLSGDDGPVEAVAVSGIDRTGNEGQARVVEAAP